MIAHPQRGFSLLEVIVAIVLLTAVGLAAGVFAINAIRASTSYQQRATAVSLASSAIEDVRTRAGQGFDAVSSGMHLSNASSTSANYPTTSESSLLSGSVTSGSVTSGMDSGKIAISTSTVTNGTTTFSVYTIVGTCSRSDLSTECGASASTTSGTSSTDHDPMIRIVAVVIWKDARYSGGSSASTHESSYTASLLVDPSITSSSSS